MTVHRYNWETMRDEPSVVTATCEHCGALGMLGDYPGEGGIVPDESGALVCDDCWEEIR